MVDNFFLNYAFNKTYKQLISEDIISNSPIGRPATAAYLYIILTYYAIETNNRNVAYDFLHTVANFLSKDEISDFNTCNDLYSDIIEKRLSPRGDWAFYDNNSQSGLIRLYMCYGDLIFYPEYLEDYENYPLIIKGMDEIFAFASSFKKTVMVTTQKYIESLEKVLK